MTAWEQPGLITTAGRLAFVYRDDYLGGSLFMALPSGRAVDLPAAASGARSTVLDKDGKPTGEKRRELSFRRAHGRVKLWTGHILRKCGPGDRRRPFARDGDADRDQPALTRLCRSASTPTTRS